MKLSPELLYSPPIHASTFNAVYGPHGLYNTEQFVLRLSPKNHRLIDSLSDQNFDPTRVNGDTIQAYSTYLHETVHWWQHAGSTTGFVMSLCYPLQAHSNIDHIRDWCNHGLAKKSIKTAAMQGELSGKTHLDIRQAKANTIVNNTMDFEFFRQWILQPKHSVEIYQNNYFESQGHCFHVVYSNLFDFVSQMIDPNSNFLHSIENWRKEFQTLTSKKITGYYYESPILRRRVGVVDIFEGQACFMQMQFLANTRESINELNDFRDDGLLHGVYEFAFKEFLNLSELDCPKSIKNPIISLFLLICDLSINPIEGFPCDIEDFPNFVNTNDPGIRFEILCSSVAILGDEISSAIKKHSKEEYMEISSLLCEECGLQHPYEGWKAVETWMNKSPEIIKLMQEHADFKFSNKDVLLRVLLSHFISFTLDKKDHPEFFCWPGYWKTNSDNYEVTKSLWLKHLSLFSDKEDDNGIFIRNFSDKQPKALKKTFNDFFQHNLLYDLSRQWVLRDGQFSFDFRWLSETVEETHYRKWAEVNFEKLYGIGLSKINI